MSENRPTCQVADCPSWCAKTHAEADIKGDRGHFSDSVCLPVIRLLRTWEPDGGYRRAIEPDELLVSIFQGQGEPSPWISIEACEDAVFIELTVESAHRLVEARTKHLTSARL
jgi:hypothetical protein